MTLIIETFEYLTYMWDLFSKNLCLRHFSKGHGNPKTDNTVFMLQGVYNLLKEESLSND